MPNHPTVSPAFTESERLACLKVLQVLTQNPEEILDKSSPRFTELSEVRAEANRLIESIKTQVRIRRGQYPGKAPKSKSHDSNNSNDIKGASQPTGRTRREGREPRTDCYVCKHRIQKVHSYYDQLCAACGDQNYRKRHQTADLTGRRSVVTGGRIRIGFQTALKLLRAGSRVEVTTRFACDAGLRFEREPDFPDWADRLMIHSLDFRDPAAVLRFTRALLMDGPVDILINNAAQTVRLSPHDYLKRVEREREHFRNLPAILSGVVNREDYHLDTLRVTREPAQVGTFFPPSLPTVAKLPHGPLVSREDLASLRRLNPPGMMTHPQPRNSWTQTIDEVHPLEFWEVSTINSFAPFLLLQQLLPGLKQSPHPRRFVINVAAKEGQFSGPKGNTHPHTNMAKAALNMLTRTVAKSLAKNRVFVNSVDPGWVSHQVPPEADQQRTTPPLDAEDGAARILDPIFQGVNLSRTPQWGQLFKDYQSVSW